MRRPVLAPLLAVAFAVAGCAPPGDQGLAERIAAQATPGATLDLAALTPFDWDRLYVMEPYTTREWFEAETGVGWPAHWAWSAVEVRDDRVFLVFARDGEVVSAFDHLYRDGAFRTPLEELFDASGLAPAEARFTVRDGPGWRVPVFYLDPTAAE